MNTENALQADDDLVEDTQTEEITGENVESAPANTEDDNTNDNELGEGEAKEPPLTPGQQANFDRALGKKVGQKKEVERRALALEQELAKIKAKLPVEERPTIPAMPDQFADNYDEQVKARDQKIVDATAYDVRQDEQGKRQDEQNRQTAAQNQKTIDTVLNTFAERGKKLGLSVEEMDDAGLAFAEHGPANELTMHIINDDAGPVILKYLAGNHLAMDKISQMTVAQAAVHIETVVKPAALKTKKTTNAPAIETTLTGGGSPPKERGPTGATFE